MVHGVSDARTDLDDRHSNTLDTLKTKPIFAMRSQANAYGAGDADDSSKQAQMVAKSGSYIHLTLPTKRIV